MPQHPRRYPHISCGSGDMDNRCEDSIGGKRRGEQREDDPGQANHHQGRQAHHEILVAAEKLVFRTTVERVRQFYAEIGPAAPEGESSSVKRLVDNQDDQVTQDVDYNPRDQSPSSNLPAAGMRLPDVRGNVEHSKEYTTRYQ